MKKMSKTEEKKLELLELATNYLQQVKDKKVKLALSTLIKKGTKDIQSLKIKEIETILEMVNDDDVFKEKTEDKKPDKKKVQKADKKTSKKTTSKKTASKKSQEKEVKKSEVVEIDYTKIFAEKVNYSELEKNHFFKKVNLTFEEVRDIHRNGEDDVFLLAHWSKSDLETFNYSGTREVPEELCRQFEKDLDILKVIYVEQYKDVLFTESVLTGATFTFFKTDFEKDEEKGCRFSEGLPFEIYVIEETKPNRKRAKK